MIAHLRHGIAAAGCLLLVAGCATAGASAPPPSAVPAATQPAATLAPSPTAATTTLEDAGVQSALPPGTYTSRVFKPAIDFTLSSAVQWSRWDDTQASTFNLRVGPPTSQIGRITLVHGPDFAQCGTGAVMPKPTAKALADAVAAASVLKPEAPTPVTVGGHAGWSIHLPGGGAAVPQDAPIEQWLKYGCVLSVGDVAFPAESLWIILSPDKERTVVFVDLDGSTLSIIGSATGLPTLTTDFARTITFK
jgi:hypothetical protein